MSDTKNPFEAIAGLGSDETAENPFESLFTDITDEDEENPFESTETPSAETPELTEINSDAATPAPAEITNDDEIPEPIETDSPAESPIPAAKSTTKTSAAAAPDPEDEQPENPLMAAIEKQEQGSLFAKHPVFKYGSAEEEIEDLQQTFDDLRNDKVGDFPELEDANRVTWSVSYGKISKFVSGGDAKKKKIGEFKKSIETSKEFLDALKKSKDKNPTCEIKPRVTAQSKGEGMASYKGIFRTIEEAEDSGKLISIVPGNDGIVYEIRDTEMGRFITPAGKARELSSIKAGFIPALPRVPVCELLRIITFFRSFLTEAGSYEAIANILWDRYTETFVTAIPRQDVEHTRARSELDDSFDAERYLHYMDVHSHNVMNAKFSSIDDRDERATRLYAVVGRLDGYFPRIKVRLSNGGKFLEIDPALVFEQLEEEYPAEWSAEVTVIGRSAEERAA